MWALAKRTGLDLNSPYAYVMWGDHHADTSVVATLGEREVVGFIMGFRVPRDPGTVFVWQIGVDPGLQGRRVGSRMLDALVARTGAHAIEATVTPGNTASEALFRALGARHGAEVEAVLAYGEHLFPDGHAPEVRFRIPVGRHGTTRTTTTETATRG